ncbi:family 20 glycosylhydrolase [Paenibacillus sp. GCM10027626]|uniref:family 20 glycosylhydrolase n=1 Tax=Paenibacillus sp. GCM10027626 TaxID=3273411 RepID=UPI0036428F34
MENSTAEIIQIPDIVLGQSEIVLPDVPSGYKVSLYGSDSLPVIDLEGKIHTPLVDVKVNLLLKVELEDSPDQKVITRNIAVIVPGLGKQTDELNEEPGVIPAVREWLGRTGDLILAPSSKIVVNPSDKGVLQKTAEITKEDLKEIGGYHLEVVYGQPNDGDIYLAIDNALAYLGKEGYVVDTDRHLSITSADAAGVFYGTRTVLQILKQHKPNHNRIPKGLIKDYPKYEIRGFMLDVGRKYYTIDFLRKYVKLMSWYKMNQFQIHLNDVVYLSPFDDGTYAAFRLESTRYPGLTSSSGSYSKEQFRNLQLLGMDYGINVIPEIDTPGHSGAFIRYNPSFGSGHNLNINNQNAVDFVKGLFDEYTEGDHPTFIGPDVHIGMDEYHVGAALNQEAIETFRKYMDTMINHLGSKGKRPYLWGGLTIYSGVTPISNNATMDIWSVSDGDPQQAIDLGYDVVNVEGTTTYIVPTMKDYLDAQFLYNDWEPNKWTSVQLPFGHPKLKGGKFALWNDASEARGISMDDAHDRLFPIVQVMAEKMWTGSRADKNYDEFANRAAGVGEAPSANLSHKLHVENDNGNVITYRFENQFEDSSGNGFNGIGHNVAITSGKYGKGARLKGGESYIQTPLRSLGFGWVVSMWINPDADNPDDAIILESPEGLLKLTQGNTGKLGFSKENYHTYFDYQVPAGRWTHLLLTGDKRGTTLYVNGDEYIEQADKVTGAPVTSRPIQTFVLPIEKIGSTTNSFKGVIDNFMIFNMPIDLLKTNVNFALNKPVEASSSAIVNFTPEKAVDGNSGTRWSSVETNPWFSIDLGEQKAISRVVINWETAFAKRYKIFVSSGGQQWTNVKGDDGIIYGNGGREAIPFDEISARYVKFEGIESGTIHGYSFFEFEVFGSGKKMDQYHDLIVQAEQLFALNKGSSSIRGQLLALLNDFPYNFDHSIIPLRRLIGTLQESIDERTPRLS